MIDWQNVREAICDGRRFTLTEAGCRVLSDTMMPSGSAIFVHLQPQLGDLFIHDGGAAFNELARQGLELAPTSTGRLRTMLRETGFDFTESGEVFRERVATADAAIGIALVADASFRAATFMLAHAKRVDRLPLDRKVQDALRKRYPDGQPNFRFNGKNRQHTFDFGVTLDGQTVLVQAVTPDMSSVSAAVVKALDAKNAPGAHVRPVLVFDRNAGWKSGDLSMLDLGGEGMEFERLERELAPLAA